MSPLQYQAKVAGRPVRTPSGMLVYPPPTELPDVSHLITDDGKPVDNLYVEKLYRLLVGSLTACWDGPGDGRPFRAHANVGWYFEVKGRPLVPDMMLSLDVAVDPDTTRKDGLTYCQWIMGKSPEVVVEIVSDTTGGELGHKMTEYLHRGVLYYVVYDPYLCLFPRQELRIYKRRGGKWHERRTRRMPEVGLGLTLWDGTYEDWTRNFLRWTDLEGNLIPTGAERAEADRERADAATARADTERQRADALEAELRRLREMLGRGDN